MSDFKSYFINEAPILFVDKPNKRKGGQLNDGTYFEIGVSLINWKQNNNIPKKKDIIGIELEFDYDDIDNDSFDSYIGCIKDYRFIDSYKKDLILQIENCRKI